MGADEKKQAVKLMNLHRKQISKGKARGWALVDEKGFARTDNYAKIRTDKGIGEYYDPLMGGEKINKTLIY